MIAHSRKGVLAAAAVGGLSLLSIALGMALLARLGGTSGQDLGRGAAASVWADILPILVAAEIVKLLIAAAQATVVFALTGSKDGATRWALLLTGLAGAVAIAASGAVGLYAVAAHQPELGAQTSALGFLGMAATGLWLLLLVVFRPVALRGWHTALGLVVAALSMATLIFAPVAILAGILGVPWWFGLAARLRSGGPPSTVPGPLP